NAENTNPFSESSQRARQEGWSNAFDGAPSVEWAGSTVESIDYSADGEDDEDGAEHYPVHNLRIVNHSPGGYCLTWPREVPRQRQAGELLGIQEDTGGSGTVDVVRGRRQVRGGGAELGIELIAPRRTPCAVRLLRKTDDPS